MKQKLALVVLALVAAIVATAIRDQLPVPRDYFDRPFEYADAAPNFGELGVVRAMEVKSVDGMRTTEAFVKVDFDFRITTYQRVPQASLIDGKGRLVKSLKMVQCETIQTGIDTTCTATFEVARDALAGATLRFHPGFTESGGPVIVRPLELSGGQHG